MSLKSIKSFFKDVASSDTAQIVQDSTGIGQSEENQSLCTSLDLSQRIQGFAFCFGIGLILSIGGTVNLYLMNYEAFSILYSLGTLVSICSSMFLRGPLNQLKSMMEETRIIATGLMLFFTFLTLMAGLAWKNPGLCMLFFICQYCASLWYMLSYIPFARDGIKKCCGACFA